MRINNFIFIKYIFLNILKPFLVISLVLTGIVWLSRSLKYIDLIINKGLSLSSYFWFVSLIAPKILALLLPLISFIAVIVIIDTFEKPLYSNFPILELIMFNLFETLTDIKLFVKDLF